MTEQNRQTLHFGTLRALELITMRRGRESCTFSPAKQGRGCSIWWDLKTCPIFLAAMRQKDDSPMWKSDTVGCLFYLGECEHGYPELHVNVECIHDDELPAIYAIMGQLGHIGIPVITEEDDVDDEDVQVAGTA